MNITLEKFMGLAITALVIFALIFGIAASTVKNETIVGNESYKSNIESPKIPTETELKTGS